MACGGVSAPSLPNHDVRGAWHFIGLVEYRDSTGTVVLRCVDHFTMMLEQEQDWVWGRADDWAVVCGTILADTTPDLVGMGQVIGDSIWLRWVTDSTWPTCSGCQAFLLLGAVDSIMVGRYLDPLHTVGQWQAQADGTHATQR
jgi:hypothetical protein